MATSCCITWSVFLIAYEVSLTFGLFALAYYFLSLSESFKIEGDVASRALLNGILNMLLKLFSVMTIIFNVFFLRIILQDQVVSTALTNISTLYDTYLTVFLYGFGAVF